MLLMAKQKQIKKSINMQDDRQVTVNRHFFWFPEFGRVEAETAAQAAEIVKSKQK